MKNFRDLKVWQKAHALALAIYRDTRQFPKEELYGLTSRIRRSVLSIPSNIAEVCGRDGDSGLTRFLRIAAGSASEADYQLLLAHDLGYLNAEQYRQRGSEIEEIKRMLTSLIRTIQTNAAKSKKAET